MTITIHNGVRASTKCYSVVHLRLLMCVIKEDPRPVLNNLISMLSEFLLGLSLVVTYH